MKLEGFTGGVLQNAFNNFAKKFHTVKHLCWSLFLIKLLAWWCAAFSRKKTLGQVFSCKFSEIFKKTYFVEHARTDAWVKWTKKCIHKIYSQENIGDGVLFRVVSDMWAYIFSKKELHHRYFSMKIGKFYGTSILQNNAARLFLISYLQCITCLISSVIAWRYNISILSVVILVLCYYISIILVILLLLLLFSY